MADFGYIGIDPGVSGCVSHFYSGAGPESKFLNTGDVMALRDCLDYFLDGNEPVTVERNHPIPGMGTVSAFTFGRNYGTLLASLALRGIEPRIVTAHAWRKWALGGAANVPKERKLRDAVTVEAAMRRWPRAAWHKAKKWREAQAASMFIAAYGASLGEK